jgi:GT2 family glycosyltransferase
MPDPICAAVVLNYNGRHLLQENLSSVVSAARKVEGGCDVIVLDNLSTDGSVEFLKEKLPGSNSGGCPEQPHSILLQRTLPAHPAQIRGAPQQ